MRFVANDDLIHSGVVAVEPPHQALYGCNDDLAIWFGAPLCHFNANGRFRIRGSELTCRLLDERGPKTSLLAASPVKH